MVDTKMDEQKEASTLLKRLRETHKDNININRRMQRCRRRRLEKVTWLVHN